MKLKTFYCLCGLVLFGCSSLFADLRYSKSADGPILTNFVEPYLTGSNYLRINGQGSIDIAVLIDDEGRIDDWLPIRTNDHYFITAIDNVIDKWRFKPRIVNGSPAWDYREIMIRFTQEGAIVNLSIAEAAMAKLNLHREDHQIVVPFSKLDRIPKPISINEPKIHERLVQQDRDGYVKFHFFIDREGNVRMPVLKDIEMNVDVAAILLDALMDWKFEAPTVRGKPVITRAIVPFELGEGNSDA